jgi:predicted nucleotide-binding protein (sugar kinase/HSP70/actin superfamily)
MGNTYIVVKALLDTLDIDFVIPPKCTKETLELGTKYSPESACLPLKLNIGNFIQSIRQGADTILMAGGCGPCRFGYYCELQKEILKDFGCDVDFIVLEAPNGDIKRFFSGVSKLLVNKGIWYALPAFINAVKISFELDELAKLSNEVRTREIKKGKTNSILQGFNNDIMATKGYKAMMKIIKNAKDELNKIDIDRSIIPVKIGIVGEIYTVIEPFSNFNIEKLLGELGVEVHRSLYIGDWIMEHIIKNGLGLRCNSGYKNASEGFLEHMIGGHAQETIGNSVLYSQKKYDGVIQLYPFSCMPEIVAQSILPNVSKSKNIPILTLIIDELTGEAGYKTRIEAFIDMIEMRRKSRVNVDEYALLRN